MKTAILAAFAALSLSVGAAYAQGTPAGFQAPVYGSQAFANHPTAASGQASGVANSTKGG